MTAQAPHQRIGYIDGLRAVAVLAVVVFHLHLGLLPNGFLGVDVFFVISGFVITRSIMGGADEPLLRFLEKFYRRRFWRLTPTLVVVVAVTLLAVALFVPPVWLSRHILFTGIGAVTATSNIVLTISSSSGYFDREAEFNPFLHTWSLGVEEQFYVLYPLIFWFVLYLARRRGVTWGRFIIPGLGLVSFGLALWLSTASPTFAFYMLPTRFWELAAGAVAFQLIDVVQRRIPVGPLRTTLGWVALVAVIASFFGPTSWVSPLPAGIIPVFGTMLLLWFSPGSGRWSGSDKWLGAAPMTYIGRISYSLYLWHWPVVVILVWTLGLSDGWTIALALLLMFGLAMATYHGLERPFIRARFAKWALPSVAFVGVVVVALGGIAGALRYGANRDFVGFLPSKSVIVTEPGWSANDLPDEGGGVVPAVTDESRPKLLVIGDSHASAYDGAATLVANRLDMRVEVSSYPGCGFTLFSAIDLEGGCAPQQAALDELKEGDIALFGALRVPRFVDMDGSAQPDYDADDPASRDARAEALVQLSRIVEDLESRGVGVVIDSPKPLFEYIPLRCADWFNENNPVCDGRSVIPQDELRERAAPVQGEIEKLLAAHPDVVFWDVFAELCPTEECRVFDDAGNTLYSDQDHLSGWGNQRVASSLEDAVVAAASARG